MEEWMCYDRVLHDLLQQTGAYPFPFGSTNLGALYTMSDAELRRLSVPRLRDQAVSVDQVFAEWKGRYLALHHVAEHQGMTPYLDRIGNSILRLSSSPRGSELFCQILEAVAKVLVSEEYYHSEISAITIPDYAT